MSGARTGGPRSVERVVEALNVLAKDANGASLAEIARRLSVPKASMSDLLNGLLACGFVRKDAGRFVLGAAALSFARQAVARFSLADLTHDYLVRIAGEVDETALVARLDAAALTSVIVDKVEGEYPVRYSVPIGLTRELYATSAGKVFLAYLPEAALDDYLRDHELAAFTPFTITDPGELRDQLRQIRAEGVATTKDERTLGASGIAAPILDRSGEVLGALMIVGLTARISPRREDLKSIVRVWSDRISDALETRLPGIGASPR